MTNTYLDCLAYTRAATGLMLQPQYGNIGRIAVASIGAVSLTLVSAVLVELHQYDDFYLFDGPNSEVLQVGAGGASVGSTTIPLQAATQYAHAGGQAYCTDGTQGSLGQALFEASRWVEDICYQPLWSTAYTGEILTMPTMRASIDNQNNLHFRPRHFPITTFTSISMKTNAQYTVSYDPTQAIIDSDQETVDLPIMAVLSQSGTSQVNLWQTSPFNRRTNAWITLAYTAGFPVGQLPWTITRACTLLTNEMYGIVENPVGADSIQQQKRNVNFVVRGDTSGESLLYKQAVKMLVPYIAQSF